jgi:manganese/iron transport system permease protein
VNLEWLLEPLRYEFFVRGLIGLSLIAVLCACVGTFVVLKGLSYIGDAMAHAVFPGIVASFLLKINYFIGGVAAAIITALSIGFVARRSGLKQDSAVGTVFVGMFALGVVLLSQTRTYSVDLAHLLVGEPLGISSSDIQTTLILGSFALIALFALQKELVLVSFDETEARVIGLPVNALNTFTLILIALTVVLAIQVVGTILVVSFLVTSSSTARLLTTRVGAMMLWGSGIGVACGVLGLYLSYFLGTPAGAMVVIVNTLVFIAVLLLRRTRNDPARV